MDAPVTSLTLKNFGPIDDLQWDDLGPINLLIGPNGCGKTFAMKALYCLLFAAETYRRGDNDDHFGLSFTKKISNAIFHEREILGDKSKTNHYICCKTNNGIFNFKIILFSSPYGIISEEMQNEYRPTPRQSRSVFFPPKEVLSLHSLILRSREQDMLKGFDDTYLDLARALNLPPDDLIDYKGFLAERTKLETLIGGKITRNDRLKRWEFQQGERSFPMAVTAEGVKKIGLLETLLANGYITPGSVVFFDEPEANLHPKALSQLLEVVADLSQRGVQFFLASHSYFVINVLELIAKERNLSIPVLSFQADRSHTTHDLRDGMPDNPIIEESVRLYKRLIGL